MEGKDILLASIDQSTTSTKFQVFKPNGDLVIARLKEHKQITPKSGWLEHDAQEILSNLSTVLTEGIEELKSQVAASAHTFFISILV